MTAPVPVSDGTTPPAEAVEAVMEALGCSGTATAWADREETRRVVVCAAHRAEWIAQGCPVAVSVAAAAVAALDLPRRDRETAAKALDEFASTRGVNVGDEDDEWWRGYRQAQRECLLDATRAASALRERRGS